LLNLQEICSKSSRFVAQILGFLVIGAANLQQISNKQAAYLAVSSGQVAGMPLGAARESKRDKDQVIEIARFPIPEQGITGRHARIGNDVWHRQGSRRQGTRPDVGS